MNKQQGFTLIELIIVIVILGILAVTAAPRFIDVQTDARKETLQGVRSALQGASQLVYAKSAIKGVQTAATSTVTIGSDIVDVAFGYPNAKLITTIAHVQEFVDVDLAGQLAFAAVATDVADPGKFRIKFASITINETGPTGCFIEYTSPSASGETPTFDVINNDC